MWLLNVNFKMCQHQDGDQVITHISIKDKRETDTKDHN